MDLLKAFDEFWYTKENEPYHLHLHNDSRSKANFETIISGSNNNTEYIDAFIQEKAKCNKETLRKIAVAFYRFLELEKNIAIVSELKNKRFYNYPIERQLEIAKYLHEEHTNEEILEKFGIDDRTLRQDLQALRDGIEIFGANIQIKDSKKGRKRYYRCTMHPVFLPLNLTEVYALTYYLPHIINNEDPNSELIKDIAGRIKSQLSDYAFKRLFGDEFEGGSDKTVRYLDDEALANSRKGALMYAYKSGHPGHFEINGKWEEGSIIFDETTQKYIVKTWDGRHLDFDPTKQNYLFDIDYK